MSDTTAQPALSLADLSTRVAQLEVITATFAKLKDTAKADLDRAMLTRHSTDNIKSAETRIDRKPAVTWSVNEPNPKVIVSDQDALNAYLEENHPTEVHWESVLVVNSAFLSALLKRVEYDEVSDDLVDPATGQVVEGLSWIPAPPPSVISARWKRDGKERVFENLRGGAMAEILSSALELPAGTKAEETQA